MEVACACVASATNGSTVTGSANLRVPFPRLASLRSAQMSRGDQQPDTHVQSYMIAIRDRVDHALLRCGSP